MFIISCNSLRLTWNTGLIVGLLFPVGLLADDWPQFRGPTGDGISCARGIPLTWSDTHNVAWKVPVPGHGRSSPVVLGDRVWLTTAVEASDPSNAAEGNAEASAPREKTSQLSLAVVCFDRRSGQLLYQTELFSHNKIEPIHPLNSHATPTPVVEPGRLFADFGAYGTAAVDTVTGKVIWKAELAVDHQLGPASSPAVFDEWLFLVRDGCDLQYVAALEKTTGREVWRTARQPIDAESGPFKKSFSTPLVIQSGGQIQVIAVGPHWVVAYEPSTGREIWRVRHGTGYSIAPRPVFGHDLVYICTGDYVAQLCAIRVDGHGDVTDTHIVWKANSQIPLMSSPLLLGNDLYFVSDSGIVSCLDATSGALQWRERIGGNYGASPVLADGRIYFFGREGKTVVLQPGTTCVRLAENQLDGTVIATPAIVENTILVRTDTHLYSIRADQGQAAPGLPRLPPTPTPPK